MDSGIQSAPSLRDRRRAETTRDILRAALDLFAAKGFDAATAGEIAERAGVSRATFFNYFPQKELILAAVARARMERVQSLLARHGSFSLDSLVVLFVEFAAENERLASEARAVLPHVMLRPACQAVVQPLLARTLQALAEGLQRGGELKRGVNARVFAESFFGLFIASVLQWAVHPDPSKGWHKRTVRRRLSQFVKLARQEAAS